MRKSDLEIRTAIKSMLENNSPGQQLQHYFAGLPDARLRRAISLLSGIYPDKVTMPDDEFAFVLYMFSDTKFIGQESFSQFVRAVNIIRCTERQRQLLKDAVKNNIELLCDVCTFELDALLVSLFEPDDLFQYLEDLTEKGGASVLYQVSYILRHEDFSDSRISDERIETLRQKVSQPVHS